MPGPRRGSVAVIAALLASSAAGCHAFVGRYGSTPPTGRDADQAFEREVDLLLGRASMPLVLAGDDALVQAFGASRECLLAPIVLRFVVVSDLQIRQHAVKLFSDRVSRSADSIVSSFEYDELQEELGWSVYVAYVESINRYQAASPKPAVSFLIHVGDAIDSGSIEEMYRFVSVSDRLEIPWLNVIGNHDVSVFGNYEKRLTYSLDSFVDFYPVGRRGFLGMHRDQRYLSGFGPALLPVPVGGHPPSTGGFVFVGGHRVQTIPATACHGFDLGADESAARRECWDYPGYYFFDPPGPAARVRIVVLDTTKHSGWGAGSEFDDTQARWFTQTLETAPGPTVLVFGHHRPSRRVLQAIQSAPHRRVFYFSGDTHRSGLGRHEVGEGSVLELNVGSILEYPQLGRLVELHEQAQGGVCVVARGAWPASFRNVRGFDWTDALQSEWDTCRAEDQTKMSLERASWCSHLGAMRDSHISRRRLIGAPQDPEAAWRSTNVILAHPNKELP